MKKSISGLLCAFLALSLFSCVSKPVPIPGERKKVLNNIYAEYMNIGDVYYSLEKYDKALEYYKLSMQNSALYWAAYYKSAKVYAVQSNWETALPMYRRLLRRDPNNDSIKASLAYIYAMTSKLKKAERAYKELVYLQPDNQAYLENLIAIYFADKQYEEGTRHLRVLIEKFPDSENIPKFKDVLKNVEDIYSVEVPLEEEGTGGERSVFDEELENPDDAEDELPPPENSASHRASSDS